QIGWHRRTVDLQEDVLAARGHLVGIERENFLAGAALSKNEKRYISTSHESRLSLQVAHPFARTHKRVRLVERNLLQRIRGRHILVGGSKVFLNGLLDIAAGKRLHHDAADPKSY